jgi:hypothetical protein
LIPKFSFPVRPLTGKSQEILPDIVHFFSRVDTDLANEDLKNNPSVLYLST